MRPARLDRPGGAHLAQLVEPAARARARRDRGARKPASCIDSVLAPRARVALRRGRAATPASAQPVDAAMTRRSGGPRRRRTCRARPARLVERRPGEPAHARNRPARCRSARRRGRRATPRTAATLRGPARRRAAAAAASRNRSPRSDEQPAPNRQRHAERAARPGRRVAAPDASPRPSKRRAQSPLPADTARRRRSARAAVTPPYRCTTVTGALGSCARIAGEYIASTRLGGRLKRPGAFSRSDVATRERRRAAPSRNSRATHRCALDIRGDADLDVPQLAVGIGAWNWSRRRRLTRQHLRLAAEIADDRRARRDRIVDHHPVALGAAPRP